MILISLTFQGCAVSSSNSPSTIDTSNTNASTPAVSNHNTGSSSNVDTSNTDNSTPTPDTNVPESTDTPTPQSQQQLQSFMLNNSFNFSGASGTSMPSNVPLDPEQVKTDIQSSFQRVVFELSADGHLSVLSNDSVDAQLSQNADGSYTISYTQSSASTNGSASRTFQGTLSGDQMTATYSGDGIGGDVVDGQEYLGGTSFTSSFTTQVTWITNDQVPATPSSGQCQFTSDGGVSLSWSSDNASTYHIYSDPLATSNEQDLGTTTHSSYTDESSVGIQNAGSATGIGYSVYSVGSTGIQSPQALNFLASTPFGQICKALN